MGPGFNPFMQSPRTNERQFPRPMPPFGPNANKNIMPGGNNNKDEFDVDELIKKIDAKIAELEKEEEENNKKIDTQVKENVIPKVNFNELDNLDNKQEYDNDKLKQIVEPDLNNAVKVNSDINKMIKNIEDEDVTDDQFFDDFFFDE